MPQNGPFSINDFHNPIRTVVRMHEHSGNRKSQIKNRKSRLPLLIQREQYGTATKTSAFRASRRLQLLKTLCLQCVNPVLLYGVPPVVLPICLGTSVAFSQCSEIGGLSTSFAFTRFCSAVQTL